MEDVVVINEHLSVPRAELSYRATRSGGPGGQHVNTSSTRVELLWDIGASASLTDDQRARLRTKLRRRIGENGVLRLTSSGSRSQAQNKEDVTARFAALVAQALHQPKRRRKTRPPKAAREARLRDKKRRSETKRRRGPIGPDD